MNNDYLVTTVHLTSGKTLVQRDPIDYNEVPEEAEDNLAEYMAKTLQEQGLKVQRVGSHYLNWDNVEAVTFEVDLEGV